MEEVILRVIIMGEDDRRSKNGIGSARVVGIVISSITILG